MITLLSSLGKDVDDTAFKIKAGSLKMAFTDPVTASSLRPLHLPLYYSRAGLPATFQREAVPTSGPFAHFPSAPKSSPTPIYPQSIRLHVTSLGKTSWSLQARAGFHFNMVSRCQYFFLRNSTQLFIK